VIDVLGFLYLTAILSLGPVLGVARRSHDDPVAVRRHADALRVAAGDAEAQLVAPGRVRVVHEERLHLLGVEYVGAAAATSD